MCLPFSLLGWSGQYIAYLVLPSVSQSPRGYLASSLAASPKLSAEGLLRQATQALLSLTFSCCTCPPELGWLKGCCFRGQRVSIYIYIAVVLSSSNGGASASRGQQGQCLFSVNGSLHENICVCIHILTWCLHVKQKQWSYLFAQTLLIRLCFPAPIQNQTKVRASLFNLITLFFCKSWSNGKKRVEKEPRWIDWANLFVRKLKFIVKYVKRRTCFLNLFCLA